MLGSALWLDIGLAGFNPFLGLRTIWRIFEKKKEKKVSSGGAANEPPNEAKRVG
jgi:hypothetical protein